MKTLNGLLLEVNNKEILDNINEELITEKLQEKHLQELASYFKKLKSMKTSGYGYKNTNFKKLFGDLPVRLDKVTENDFEKFKKGDKNGIKKAKQLLKANNYVPYLILYLDENDKIAIAVTPWLHNSIFINRYKTRKEYDYETHAYKDVQDNPDQISTEKIRQMDLTEFCNKYDFWLLNLNNFVDDRRDIRTKRDEAKRGTINKQDYAQIARDNVKRYKSIIAKHKAEQAALNDTISTDVKQIVNDVLDLSTKIMKGGAKYNSCQYSLKSLIQSIYTTKTYSKGHTYGYDGLLPLYNNYIDYTIDNASGSYYSFENPEKVKQQIIGLITKIQKMITDLKKKMEEC